MGNISHLEKEMDESDCGEGSHTACLYSVCWMARWQTDADLSQDTQICVLQMYSEGHSPSALQQPSSFKFNNNSFMQNMRQSGAGWMEGWGCPVFLLLAGFKLWHSRADNNIHGTNHSGNSLPIHRSLSSFCRACYFSITNISGLVSFTWMRGHDGLSLCFYAFSKLWRPGSVSN